MRTEQQNRANPATTEVGSTTCVIVGGGPAGMVLGLLLARAGVDVTVLEKHADFRRDFRGSTVHSATLRLLDELGLAERFSSLPHSVVRQMKFDRAGRSVTVADFKRLRQPHPYIALVPQWDLLNLLAEAGESEPTFTLKMRTEVTGLLREGDRVTGVRYEGPEGPGELSAHLTVACDGRWSRARSEAGLTPREYRVDFDLWLFRLPNANVSGFRSAPGKALWISSHRDYMQVAYVGPKGSDAQLRARGVDVLRSEIVQLLPEAAASVAELTLDDVKHLDVRVNRLRRWHTDGLLCIGDAAHAMSPVGGVGINLAVQDAVGAAIVLAKHLRRQRVSNRHLVAVRRRRVLSAAVTQAVQRIMHKRMVGPVLRGENVGGPSKMFERFPFLAVVSAHFLGVGVRADHAPLYARRSGQLRSQ